MSYTDIGGFNAALSGKTIKLAPAIRIVRKDGEVFAFVRAQRNYVLPSITVGNITVPETTYLAQPNMTPSDVEESSDLKPNNMEVKGIMGTTITEADVRKGLFEDASFTLLLFFRDALTKQQLRMRGKVGDVSVDGQEVTFRLRSLSDALQKEIIELTSPTSRYTWDSPEMAFFDQSGNAADGKAVRLTTTITSVTTQRRKFVLSASTAFPAHRFTEGVVEWLSGANTGLKMEILEFVNTTGTFTLWHPTDYDIAAGDSVRVTMKVPQTIDEWVTIIGDAEKFGGEDGIVTAEAAADVNDTLNEDIGLDEDE